MELETHLLLLPRLSYLRSSELENALSLADEIGKMLSGLSKSLRKTTS
jgi:four helix bundle protein